MTQNKQKLELTWIGKGDEPKLEPRILTENPDFSYGDPNDQNMLIHGDNLLALKALEQDYTGKINCIYIDPPFNTGAAFEHYDDGIEHSIWLSLMKNRLQILRNLLAKSGSIYVHIDNNEQAYLKVVMDEIFGRKNFIQMISVKRASPAGFKVINPGPLTVTDYILLYAKEKEFINYYPQRIAVKYDENYDSYIINPDEKPEHWNIGKLVDILYQQYGFTDWKDAKSNWGNNWKDVRNNLLGELAIEKKEVVISVRDPHKPSDKIKQLMATSKQQPGKVFTIQRDNHKPIYIYNGGSLSFYKDKLRIIDGVLTPTELLTDFWHDINFAGIAKEGNVQFKNSKKPEMLIRRILELSTKEGDLILDSFLGSGTTAAVAQKMGRKWIGIELGDHAKTHCYRRLKAVIDGEQSGVSKAVNWQGGGGFRYYTLAPSLLKLDKFGQWVISPEYNPDMLAAAMAKHEDFIYQPSTEFFWKHGFSNTKDFIFTTTQYLTYGFLTAIAEELQEDESLLICCTQYEAGLEKAFPNINLHKIPAQLLSRCEFGNDDYSLNIINSPLDGEETEIDERETDPGDRIHPTKSQQDLFSQDKHA